MGAPAPCAESRPLRVAEVKLDAPGRGEIVLTDERGESARTETYFYKDGIKEFVKQLGENKQVLFP